MAISAASFWKLLVDSQIASSATVVQWRQELASESASKAGDAVKSAEWLVQRKRITGYHASVLLTGHPGPFLFGDYFVFDRIRVPRITDRFRAVHRPTKFPLWLDFASPKGFLRDKSAAAVREQGARHCRVSSPSLSDCYEVDQRGNRIFLAEEAVAGRSIDTILAQHVRLTVEQVSQIGYHAAVALATLHRADLVHTDLRIGDLWVNSDRRVTLLRHPFRIIDCLPSETSTVADVESQRDRARYVAPELLLPGETPTPQSDLYALGVAMYRMLVGCFPFDGSDVEAILQQLANQQPSPPSQKLPRPITNLVLRLLSKRPSDRGPTAVDVATTLRTMLGDVPWGGEVGSDPRRDRYRTMLQATADGVMHAPKLPAAETPAVKTPSVSPASEVSPAPAAVPTRKAVPAPIVVPVPTVTPASGGAPSSDAVPRIDPDRSTTNLKPRRRSSRNTLIAAIVASLFVIVAVGGWVVHRLGNPDRSTLARSESGETQDTDGGKPMSDRQAVDPVGETREESASSDSPHGASRYHRVPDDGRLLWASPTEGDPVTLRYVPTSAKFFVCIRPAEWLGHEEGQRVLRAFGPTFQRHLSRWEQRVGIRLAEVERLTLAWAPRQGEMPKLISVLWTTDPLGLPSGTRQTHQDKAYVVEGDLARYQPIEQEGRVTVVGTVALVQEVIEQGDASPILRRDLGLLRQVSDDARQVTVLFSPNFLFRDGRPLFGDRVGRLLGPLEDLLGDGIDAGLLSFHLGDAYDFHGELRLLGRRDLQPAEETTAQLHARLDRVPVDIENYLSRYHPDGYWRLIAGRFDNMLAFVRGRLRYGTERDQTIVNFVVPAPAAHNLVLASELALATSFSAAATEPDRGPSTVRGLVPLLQQRTTLEFDQRSLEASLGELESLVRETFTDMPFDFRIEILGRDLQMEGITRNQQVKDFRQIDKTVAQILTAIVMTANPVTTVKVPSESDQKLVWCVIHDPQRPGQRVVAITTRKAAGEKGYELPEEFRQK